MPRRGSLGTRPAERCSCEPWPGLAVFERFRPTPARWRSASRPHVARRVDSAGGLARIGPHAQEVCVGLRGEERGECQRNCVAQCGCPEGTTFCPDDGLCYNLQTNNCHCADVRVSGGSPCGGVCPGSGKGRCCGGGVCGGASDCPIPFTEGYCTAGIPPRGA
jgi:hypothetical protein